MSVYIKGMEMPKSCWECHFGHGDTGVCVVDFRKHGDWNEPQDCPLIPVPPHGRCIDADALNIYSREERAMTDLNDSPFSEYLEGVKDGLHEAAKMLSTAPTIIPAEEGET